MAQERFLTNGITQPDNSPLSRIKEKVDRGLTYVAEQTTIRVRERLQNSFYKQELLVSQEPPLPIPEPPLAMDDDVVSLPEESFDAFTNGTRRMLLNFANPNSLSSANPEYVKTVAAIALYDGEGPLEEIAEVAGVSPDAIRSHQTPGIYTVYENDGSQIVTSQPLLGVNPEANILFTSSPDPDTSRPAPQR